MEKPAEGEFDTWNTQEAAVVAPGLTEEQKPEKRIYTEDTWEAHSDISWDLCNLLYLKGTWKHIQVLGRWRRLIKHADDTWSLNVYIVYTFLSFAL